MKFWSTLVDLLVNILDHFGWGKVKLWVKKGEKPVFFHDFDHFIVLRGVLRVIKISEERSHVV